MLKANVSFFGKERDDYGMPSPFHAYLVIASPWERDHSGVATAVPLTIDTPSDGVLNHLSLDGGPQKAFDELLDRLRKIERNDGLTERVYKL